MLIQTFREDLDRWSTVFFSVACSIVGIFIMANNALVPPSLERGLMEEVIILWAVMLTIGGLTSIFGILSDRLRAEAAGNLALALAFAIYDVALVVVQSIDSFVAVLFFTAFSLAYGLKAHVLNKVARERGRSG